MFNDLVQQIRDVCWNSAELDTEDNNVIINVDSIRFANCDNLVNKLKNKLAKEISVYWYNELHGKFNPITQKQKLIEFINNLK